MNETKNTAAACTRSSCQDCQIKGRLMCVHTKKDLMDFLILFFGYMIPFLMGIYFGGLWVPLLIWLGLALIFFIYVEALVLCRHCPHYAEKGKTLRCHANWGLPKIPKYSPRPMNKLEQIIWLIYVAVFLLFYIPIFIMSSQWIFLILTTSALLVGIWTIQRTQCNRCYHLTCPVNRVPQEVKDEFYKNYPEFNKESNKKK